MIGNDGIFGEGTDKHQPLQVAAVAEPGAACSVKGDGLRPVRQIALAQDRQIAVAVEAMAAMRVPRQDHMVADREPLCRRAALFDNPRRFVPEHDRQGVAQ